MKAPNFKITICDLSHYFSAHCVLFGFFLLHLSTDGEIGEKRIIQVDSFLLDSFSHHLHMNIIKMKSRIARTIVAVLNTIYIGLFLTVLLSCSDNSKLCCLTSDNSFTACVF